MPAPGCRGVETRRLPAALLLVFAAWTATVSAGWLDPLDTAVGPALVDGDGGAWHTVTSLGDKPAMAVLLALAAGIALLRRDWVGTLLAGGIPVVGWGVGLLLKASVARPRPEWALVVEESAAYPSNHALTGWLLWVCVVYVLARHHPMRARFAAAGAVPAVAVAYSRVALGVHHVSDILGAWLLGLAVLAALPALTRWLDARWPRPRGTILPAPDGA